MIRNEREHRITKAQADRFRATIETQANAPPAKGVHPRLQKAATDALRAQLGDLERELETYDALQRGGMKKALRARVEDLGTLLVQARIARGWSQRELGERVGLHMQKIQQYEASEYAGASFTRVREICQALGAQVEIAVRLVELPARDALAVPGLKAAGGGQKSR